MTSIQITDSIQTKSELSEASQGDLQKKYQPEAIDIDAKAKIWSFEKIIF